jgi:hypothetical protein
VYARYRPNAVCDAGGLRSAHSEPVQFERDGLYLLHKEGHYLLGQSPLALIWKDASCCRFLLDTDLNGNPLQYQVLAWLHTSLVSLLLQGLALGCQLCITSPCICKGAGCCAMQCSYHFVALT